MKNFIKSVILLNIALQFFSLFGNYKYELAVCAIFQNEARFMKEWIEFHKLVGVQFFYLYNNFSNDNYLNVLKEYIKKNEVELVNWNVQTNTTLTAQYSAFNDALKKAKGVVKWLAFLDLDEFLFPVKKDNLRDFLHDYEEFGGICANWVMFGTSDIEKIPENKLMTELLIKCDSRGNNHVKSIVRPERVLRIHSHSADYIAKYFQVNSNKVNFIGPYSPYICLDKIRINHYWTRDLLYLYQIKLPRVQSLKENLMAKDGWYIDYNEAKKMTAKQWCLEISNLINKDVDKTIYKYLDRLKKKVGKK